MLHHPLHTTVQLLPLTPPGNAERNFVSRLCESLASDRSNPVLLPLLSPFYLYVFVIWFLCPTFKKLVFLQAYMVNPLLLFSGFFFLEASNIPLPLFLKRWSADQQHRHPLGACLNAESHSALILNPLNCYLDFWRHPQVICMLIKI